ncbi:MAG: hypothetical protein ACYSTG_03885 [Planctomycetota bacterium]|jgi:hypothetical protein
MDIMKKVWIYKRKGIKGWWVGWYESGKRKVKALPTRKLAEHYCRLKYSQLNSDVFTGVVRSSEEKRSTLVQQSAVSGPIGEKNRPGSASCFG